MLGVGPDGFDHQVQLIGTVDIARHSVGLARHEVVGLGEVMQPIDLLRVAIQQQHRARPLLLPRGEVQAIGAQQDNEKT